MTALPFSLRPATVDDRQAIAEMWLRSWASTRLALEQDESRPTAQTLRERLDDEMVSKWCVTVAERGGAILGFLALDIEAAVLDQLFVAPEHHGQSIGSALLTHAIQAMPGGFTLRTAAENEATGFYDKAGLQRVRMMVHPTTGHRLVQYRWPGTSPDSA